MESLSVELALDGPLKNNLVLIDAIAVILLTMVL